MSMFPANPNFLHPNKFKISFSRIPNIQFFGQIVNIPGISLTEIPKNNPFVELYSPGEKAIYDVLNITFAMDEDMVSWLSIHEWLRACVFPTSFDEYKNLNNPVIGNKNAIANSKFPQFSDCILTILSNSNVPNVEFLFHDVFPTNLSTFTLSSTDSPDSVITCDATFRYSWYDVKKL